MLGYVSIKNVLDKSSLKKYGLVVKNCDRYKVIDIELYKKFDIKNEKHLKKILKIFKKQKIDSIVFENKVLREYKQIVDKVYTTDIEVVTGNLLYTNMATNIVDYIFYLCENVQLEEIHLGIAMELISYNKLEFIKKMSNNVRAITILTSAPFKFDNLCKDMLNTYGIVIKCTDNFKSGLRECDFCVNFDMNNSEVVGGISNKSIYINLNMQISKMKKSFKGIVINDIVVDISDIDTDNVELQNFRTLAIAQSYDTENINRKILGCIGINGNIASNEFSNFRIYRNKNKGK